MKKHKMTAALTAAVLILLTVFGAYAAQSDIFINYSGGKNVIDAVPAENISAEFIDSLYLVASDHAGVTFGTKGWKDGYSLSSKQYFPVKYIAVSNGETDYSSAGITWSYPAPKGGKYDLECTLMRTYSTFTDPIAFSVSANQNYSGGVYLTKGGSINGTVAVYEHADDTTPIITGGSAAGRGGEDGRMFIEIEVKIYKAGTKEEPSFPYLYIAFSDIDAGQSFKISSEDKAIVPENMYIRQKTYWPGNNADLKNMYDETNGTIYSEYLRNGTEITEVTSNEDPDKILTVYNKTNGVSSGVNLVYGYSKSAGAGLMFYAQQIKITYKSDDLGEVTGITEEDAFEGGNPEGSETTPDPGYALHHWTCDKDVILEDGTPIKAGDEMTPDMVKKVVAMEDLIFTAHHEPAYHVTYNVTPDPVYGTPLTPAVPVDNTDYFYEETVKVADPLTSTQKYAEDNVNFPGEEIPGTWSFTKWDKEDFDITEDTTITGAWTFTPDTFSVNYNVVGDNTYGIPGDCVVPDSVLNIAYGDNIELEPVPSTNWKTADGTDEGQPGNWKFAPFWTENENDPDAADLDTNKLENIKSNRNVYGKWTFTPTYKVTYIAEEDPTWGSPKDAEAPVDDTEYESGQPVTVADDLVSSQNYAIDPSTGKKQIGKWSFEPWDKDDFNITQDTQITGRWVFTPDWNIPQTGYRSLVPVCLALIGACMFVLYLTVRKMKSKGSNA